MTPKRLARAIAAVLAQPAMRARAAALRDAMVQEDGVRNAVARIEEVAGQLVTRDFSAGQDLVLLNVK